MKRTLIVAAVATLGTTAALAQSSVTVYGRINTSAERMKNYDSSDSVYKLNNNGSRLGFKGVEDLGGGLKAGFTLEHRLESDTGASSNGTAFWGGAGESSVYLTGAFGTIKAGHYTSEAYFATSDATDLLNHGTGTSSDALYQFVNGSSNKVSYRTPEMSGVWAELGVIAGEGRTERGYDFAANYNAGPLGLGLGYEKQKDGNSQIGLRASYSVDAFTVTGYVQRFKDVLITDDSTTVYRISGQYNIGAAELHAAYGAIGELSGNGVTIGKARQFTVGANYNLSKRTKVYAYYNRINNDSTAAYSTTVNLGADPSTFAVGVRHNF